MTETVKPILEINNLKKRYRLGSIGRRTLVADWQAFWDKRKGREDPRIKLGKERLIGQTFMALNGINLKIYPGEAVGIIGINGAGKSTMLKLISRITGPTEGEIIIRGKITSMLEVGTGFDPELTGRENIYMNGTVLGMKRAEIDAKMEDIINFSEVRDFIDTPVKRQRYYDNGRSSGCRRCRIPEKMSYQNEPGSPERQNCPLCKPQYVYYQTAVHQGSGS